MSENFKESRKILVEKMEESVKYWRVVVETLSRRIREDHLKDVYNIQADAINYRQFVSEDVRNYSVKIHKLMKNLKVLQKSKFEFYATSYQVKTSGTEKLRLIEADLSDYQSFINELDEHVDFLKNTSKNLDNINYAVKNRIELANILGTT